MAKVTYNVADGTKLIGDVQTADIEDSAVTLAKLASAKLLYTGVYEYAEYGRCVYA